MSLRHAGLLAVGVLFCLAGVLILVSGDAATGAMSALFGLVMVVVPAAELVPDGSGARLEGGALVVAVNRTRRALLVAGAALFAATSLLLVFVGDGPFARWAGVAGVLLFGTFAVVGAWQLRGPWRLVMTPQALRWDQGKEGPAVPWDEIADVGMLVIRGVQTMTIDVERPDRLPRSVLAGVNRKLGGGDVNVPLNQMSVDEELLLSLVTVCAHDPRARDTIATEATVRRLQA